MPLDTRFPVGPFGEAFVGDDPRDEDCDDAGLKARADFVGDDFVGDHFVGDDFVGDRPSAMSAS